MKKITYGTIKYEPLFVWDEDAARDKLEELYHAVLDLVDDKIWWFQRNRAKKAKAAKTVRWIAIVFFVASTIMPCLAAITEAKQMIFLYAGYIFAILGAGVVAIDRFNGLSASRVRLVITGDELTAVRNAFVENWQRVYFDALPFDIRTYRKMTDYISLFTGHFNDIARADTKAWGRDFQANLDSLASALKVQGEQLKADLQAAKQPASDTAAGVPMTVIKEAIDRKYDDWKNVFGVVGVSAGTKMTSGKTTGLNALVFHPPVKLLGGDHAFTPIPASIRYDSVDGRSYDIPTDVVPTGIIRASAALLCDGLLPKRPGCSVSRNVPQATGTIGLQVLRGGVPHILGCYHVLCAPELSAGAYTFSGGADATLYSPGRDDSATGVPLGQVVDGRLSDQLDAALAELDPDAPFTDTVCAVDQPLGDPITITDAQAANRYPVRMIGRTSGDQRGAVLYNTGNFDINYMVNGRWTPVTLKSLVTIQIASEGGDSGAPVLDNDNNVVGLLIADNGGVGYVLPIQRILAQLSVTLK